MEIGLDVDEYYGIILGNRQYLLVGMSCYMVLLPSPVTKAIVIKENLSWWKNMDIDGVRLELMLYNIFSILFVIILS